MCGSELCRARRAAGLPALAVGWGPIANVGVMAESDKVQARQFTIGQGILLSACKSNGGQPSRLANVPWMISPLSVAPLTLGSAALQAFGSRMFQLTAPQPVDEVLSVLGDVLSADQSKLPTIFNASRLRNQNAAVSLLEARLFKSLICVRWQQWADGDKAALLDSVGAPHV